MRIGIMLRNLNEKGGIQGYTINLLESMLQMAEHDLEFILIYSDPQYLGTFSRFKNVKEIAAKASNKILWDQITVPRIIREEKIDMIYNPKLSIPLFTKAKKILMIHGAEQYAVKSAFKWYDRIYVRIAMPLYSFFANRILTNTQMGVDDLSRYLHIRKDKFAGVHEGVHKRFKIIDDTEKKRVKEKYDLPEKFILYVGGLTPLKNFRRLALAFDTIAEKNHYHLVVTGFKRFKFQQDLDTVESLSSKNKIKFCGFVPDEDLPGFYNLAEMFVFPSLYEGFGLPVLEAMACGCPIITSETGCTKEVTGDAAILIDPYDIHDIAEKIELLAVDKKLKNDLIAKGFERVKNFSWDKCAAETLNVFYSSGLNTSRLGIFSP